ncbi:uncharacterized protein [Pleurodeles waltl]|uniref:uncharacterized protein isoform X1 n=1 Tax=Pleurodeles waltl TaxID=8319 RepID=UPI00370983BD
MEAALDFCQSILTRFMLSFWSSVFSLAVLWLFSVYCLGILERFPMFCQLKQGLQGQQQSLDAKKQLEYKKQAQKTRKAAAPSIANAEEFVKLFEAWLYAEDVETGTRQAIIDHINKLQNAGKEVQRINLVIASFQMKRRLWMESYDPLLNKEGFRVQTLTDKFEYIKTYVEMRLFLLKNFIILSDKFAAQRKEVLVWVDKTQDLQETLHATPCDDDSVIEKHLEKEKNIIKEMRAIEVKLHRCQETMNEMTMLLKEIETWTEKFRQTICQKGPKNGGQPWTVIMTETMSEEIKQLRQQFASLLKLTSCYTTHLEDLRLLSKWRQVAQQYHRRTSDIPEMFQSMLQQVSRRTSSMTLKGFLQKEPPRLVETSSQMSPLHQSLHREEPPHLGKVTTLTNLHDG